VTTGSPIALSPAAAGAVPLARLLAGRPLVLNVGDNLDQIPDAQDEAAPGLHPSHRYAL
jgi:hypothetical protein